jgi:Xaa-Pro aminopeptidase
MDLLKFIQKEGIDAYLMHADSLHNADMYYATGFLAGDAFTYLYTGREILLVSGMEKGRASKESKIDDVRSSSEYEFKDLLKVHKDDAEAYCIMLERLLKEEGCNSAAVPRDFPVYLADRLREDGFHIISIKSPISKTRERKNDNEIKVISIAQRACEQAAAKALDVISKAQVRGDDLIINGIPLSAQYIKALIHHSLLDNECEAHSSIVACGPGSANPHWEGEGLLKTHQPIVLDIFPRHMIYRYYSDMSRTVARGEPEPKIKEMYQAVLTAQKTAFDHIISGVKSCEIHQAVCDSFTDAGFHVGDKEGFIHSTGHSVGLDIHEKPGIGPQDDILEAGNVVTVEPGLYYHDVGGVRIEDMVVVTKKGCKNLTKFNKNLLL